MIPGEIQTQPGEIEINAGRPTLRVSVANTGDRPIQVGSHYHFFETNAALAFDAERPVATGSTSRPGRPCASNRARRATSNSSP